MADHEIMQKRHQIENLSNELRLMELEEAVQRTQKEIENHKNVMAKAQERQKLEMATVQPQEEKQEQPQEEVKQEEKPEEAEQPQEENK